MKNRLLLHAGSAYTLPYLDIYSVACQAPSAASMQSPTSSLDQQILAAKPAPENPREAQHERSSFKYSDPLPGCYLVSNMSLATYSTFEI